MSNLKFYTVFSILNILLVIFLILSIFFTGDLIFGLPDTNARFLCGIIYMIIYIALKLRLPKIFTDFADKYKNSLINKFVEFIHNNPQQKKFILPTAFCFDLPFILYWITLYDDYSVFLWVPFSYFLCYAGGVLFFYIMLYRELEIKDGNIKPFF